MLYTAAQIVGFLVAATIIGLALGYFLWGKGGRAAGFGQPTEEVDRLRRQLAATRKRAASAEAEVTEITRTLNDARTEQSPAPDDNSIEIDRRLTAGVEATEVSEPSGEKS